MDTAAWKTCMLVLWNLGYKFTVGLNHLNCILDNYYFNTAIFSICPVVVISALTAAYKCPYKIKNPFKNIS